MFAFTHLVFAWLAGKGYEKIAKKELSNTAWLLLLLGSLMPDIDFLLDWTLKTELHRTFTHSLFFVASGALIVYCLFAIFKIPERRVASLAFAAGIFTHLLLDMLFSYGVPLFWPSLLHFSFQGIQYFDPATPSFLHQSVEVMKNTLKKAVLDMAMGTMWIFYIIWRKKVKL